MPAPLGGRKRLPDGFIHTYETMKSFTILDKITGCWNWTMSLNWSGYGQVRHKQKSMGAHRLMFMLVHPKTSLVGKFVCHHCDNPRCINPDHLYAGTPMNNMHDMIRRGRAVYPGCPGGEAHKDAKLTERLVREIRKRHAAGEGGYRRLAQEYGVDRTTIKLVVRRLSWKHVK